MTKPFYQLNSIEATPETFTNEGYRVINFGMVKKEIVSILGNKETAIRFHLYNDITDNDPEMKDIKNRLELIVFKESRGDSNSRAIGWENGNSYLRYHSGIIYKWFN
jgi:hypothetical protein